MRWLCSLASALAVGVLALAQVAAAPSRGVPEPRAAADLAAARVDAAKAAFAAVQAAAAAGTAPSEAVYTWSVRWLNAAVEAGGKEPAALQDHFKRMKDLEAAVNARYQAGTAASTEFLACTYYRAEAEVWAARNKLH